MLDSQPPQCIPAADNQRVSMGSQRDSDSLSHEGKADLIADVAKSAADMKVRPTCFDGPLVTSMLHFYLVHLRHNRALDFAGRPAAGGGRGGRRCGRALHRAARWPRGGGGGRRAGPRLLPVSGPSRGVQAPVALSTVNWFSMALLDGCAGRLTAQNGVFRPGQSPGW